jgi:hypothetical protein
MRGAALALLVLLATRASHAAPVPLRDIAIAYQGDAAAADALYKGKRIAIVGSVEKVSPDSLGMLVEGIARVIARLDSAGQQESANVRDGQTIAASCVIDGTGFYMVEMSQCHGIAPQDAATPPAAGEKYPLQEYNNTPDMECDPGRRCSDDEFRDQFANIRAKWPLTPDAIKAKCFGEPTLPTLTSCVIQATMPYLNSHPDAKPTWLP